MTTTFERAEVENAFRHYFLTGPVHEDWAAWSRLFTDEATYTDHYYGVFRGSAEIQYFLEGTMSAAPHVYSPLVWHVVDGARVVYKVVNRADDPDPAGPPIEFPSLQVIEYAGEGKWASEDDWWTVREMRLFSERYAAARHRTGATGPLPMSRRDWGEWVDWARPAKEVDPSPSWLGRDVRPITRLGELTRGVRHPRPAPVPQR
ncbi:nuclear transport factor 2 family protein [Streptomyces sp. NPDC055092]